MTSTADTPTAPAEANYEKIREGVATHQQMYEQFNLCPDASDDDLRSGKAYAGRWFEIEEQSYETMLDLLPPLFMRMGMFAMSEFRAGSVASVFFAIPILGETRWFHGWCNLADRRGPDMMRAAILDHETAEGMTRDERLEAIWANTHPDYRGIAGAANPSAWPPEHRGKKTILVNGGGVGTMLKLLEELTDAEIEERRYLLGPGAPGGQIPPGMLSRP
ncbi:DUF1419 domain-containing protein [Sphingomonas oryzagri]